MKILIRLPNWLGDVVMSTAFITAVREFYPDAAIDVIIKKELSCIASLIPGLNAVLSFSKQEYTGIMGAYRFGKQLRSEKYDLFFNLPTSLSSLVVGWATGAKKRVGFGKEGGFLFLSNSYVKPLGIHRVDEYIALLEFFISVKVINREVKIKTDEREARSNKLVIVNFNSEAASRRMPVNKAKRLLAVLCNAFADVRFGLIGSPKEEAFIDSLIGNNDRLENYAGKTSLAELVGLMASALAVVTTDSGPAHLANSLGIPTIALFGAGNEFNTAPYNKNNLTVLRAGKLSCEPCVKNTCELYGIPKCMELLDEVQIVDTLSVYLTHA